MKKNILNNPFFENIDILWKHINRNEIFVLSREFEVFLSQKKNVSETSSSALSDFADFFSSFIEKNYTAVEELRSLYEEFNSNYSKLENEKEKNEELIKFVSSFGKTSIKKKNKDKKSLKRYFDKDAAIERYQKYSMKQKKLVSAFFRCLPALLKNYDFENKIENKSQNIIFNTIFDTLDKEKISRIRIDILSALAKIVSNSNVIKDLILADAKESYLSALLFDSNTTTTWENCEILNILNALSYEDGKKNIEKALDTSHNPDIFVRRHAVKIIIENSCSFTDLDKPLQKISDDSSPFVRQKLAESLYMLPQDKIGSFYTKFLVDESEIAVTCSALKQIPALISIDFSIEKLITDYKKLLNKSVSPKLLEFALLNLVECFEAIEESNTANRELWLKEFYPVIEKLHCEAEAISTRRRSAQTAELLWCKSTPEAMELFNLIKRKTETLKLGKSVKLNNTELSKFDDITIGRVLSVISQNDCSLELKKSGLSYRLIRNYRFGFKWWRFIHEFRNPSPDKRQTFSHFIGRLFRGEIRSSSSIMGELSETKVPGEPLFISQEGNSRPYIPLPDEIISASETPDTIKVFTPEGITSIVPPKSMGKRFMADVKFAFNFKKYATLRNWQEGFQQSPAEYITEVKKLGFDINITPYPKSKYYKPSIDPKVKRFFSIQFLLPLYLSDFYNNLRVYFFSLYQNTLPQLAVFVCALLAIFFGRHITLNALIRKSRAAIPLVIGGWGTRGKSGTERIKAALFASLGCSVISKTTGCEAMFLYTPPFERTYEMFLFRPYDKATIWEQFNIFRLAHKLEADVFLWECMALAPSYVRILQQDWMKDDLSTITNTYPDHEDIQGPAGWNIAETMTNFVPTNGNVVTAEEQLFPFLETAAKYKNTKFAKVDWRDAILIPSDILSRFPYEEHPHNIALVLKLVENLGIEKEFALKEMADNVVPDIGVLKKYPTAKVKSRQLEFLSGMSANERFGCMQNWTRMGLDTCTPEKYPDTWITTVVNNRADRIARSRAFAKILVEDLSVDRHFLIGSNLKGMLGYIKEAWDVNLADFSLWNETKDVNHALEQFNIKVDSLRIPKTNEQLKNFLAVMLKTEPTENSEKILALFEDPKNVENELKASGKYKYSEEIAEHYKKYHKLYSEYTAFVEKIEKASNHEEIDKLCKTLLWNWYEQKLIVVHNYSATGNQIIEIITKSVPPGIYNKIMALQNIKGTGLDFFYRWQAWENCYNLCETVKSSTEDQLESSLTELSKISSFEVLAVDTVTELVSNMEKEGNNTDSVKILLNDLKAKLEASTEKKTNDSASETKAKSSDNSLWLKFLENFIDPGDSVKRRRKVDKIYRDLSNGQVSYSQTISTLQKLNKRQKGGWLKLKK